jgi:hypothetical protein
MLRCTFLTGTRIKDGTKVKSQVRPQKFGAEVDLLLKGRLGLIETQAHVELLGTLPRKHEYDGRIAMK